MSASHSTFELKAAPAADGVLYAELSGDLAWDSADELLEAARAQIDAVPDLSDVHLDCARMTLCDSMGLSTLLALHRHAAARGVRLHLDRRPVLLDRLLRLTGTYEHLTGRSETATAGSDGDTSTGAADGPRLPGP
ncbi:STAS domain-containing protein [Streptomyces sp. NBC_00691]|uniref:STAS domain-containing protein n=1 Tax=Streptomyces sp. NBC_00691 TaxID=2903671 RepID=UPI002E2F0A14|nr:STAS domain-containing protein [Streptomyces sp. NBC_00691]